jgi:hypothetical protein
MECPLICGEERWRRAECELINLQVKYSTHLVVGLQTDIFKSYLENRIRFIFLFTVSISFVYVYKDMFSDFSRPNCRIGS